MKRFVTSLLAGAAMMAVALPASAQWSVTPELGSTMETLSEMTMTTGRSGYDMTYAEAMDPSKVQITKDGVPFTGTTVSFKDDYSNYKNVGVVFTPEISEAGTYTIKFEVGAITLVSNDGESEIPLEDYDIPVTYTITGVTEILPAEYNMPLSYLSSTTIDLSGSIYAGNISLPDDAQLIDNAKALLRNMSVGYLEEVPMMVFNPGNGNVALVQLGNVTKPVYNGEYTLVIPKGAFGNAKFVASNGETGVANDTFEVTLTFTGGQDDPNAGGGDDPVDKVEYTLEYSNLTGNGNPMDVAVGMLSSVSVRYAADTQLVAGSVARLVNIEAGYDQEVAIRLFGSDMTGADYSQATFLLGNLTEEQLPETKGTYSLMVPQGIFGDAKFIESDGKEGVANPAYVIPIIIENSKGQGGDGAKIESVVYVSDDTDIDMATADLKLAALEDESKLLFNTTSNINVGYIYMTVTDLDAYNPDEAIVSINESHARRTLPENRGVYWQDDEVPFLQFGRKLELIEGHRYQFDAKIYDFENPPYSRELLDEWTVTIEGATPGYPYAFDIHMTDLTPDPETYIISTVEQAHFTMTFDAPIKVAKAVLADQQGGAELSVEDCVVYSEDNTSFTFTFPAAYVESCQTELPLQLFITDMEGHALWCGSDTKENSYISVCYSCYCGAPDLTITPASGVVTEIKDFEISCPGGPDNGMINYSYFGGVEITDMSGDRVFASFPEDFTGFTTLETGRKSDPQSELGYAEFPTKLGISLKEPITTPGRYVVHFLATTFALGSEFDTATSKDTFITLDIEGEIADETVYDFAPVSNEVTFNEDMTVATVLLTFPDQAEVNDTELAKAQLKDKDGNLVEGVSIERDFDFDDLKVWKVMVEAPYADFATYTLSIGKGTFGDVLWASDATYGQYLQGHANPAFDVEIVTSCVGVDAINADAAGEAQYFNLQGVRVENPTAGIYVRVLDGKATKVVIR